MDTCVRWSNSIPGDVNAPQPDGSTALLWAAYWNDEKAVEELLAAGANVNASNRDGFTALSQACTNGNAQMVEALLKAGADANSFQAEGQTVLMTAARAGSAEAVKLLLDHGAEVNAKESWRGQTALMWATAENHPVRRASAGGSRRRREHRFVRFSTFSEHEDQAGRRAHALPARRIYRAAVCRARRLHRMRPKILLDHGADIKAADPDGTSALVLAIINGHFDTAAFLLDRKADPNAADTSGPRAAVRRGRHARHVRTATVPRPRTTAKWNRWT